MNTAGPSAECLLSAADLADRFSDFAKAARGTAMKNKAKGDEFGEKLANRRAEVYDSAAVLLNQQTTVEAAKTMMERAGQLHVRTPPLIDFDKVGLQYIAARAWQHCALMIDPTVPQTAPKWE
ncbi:MAG: hypothetical protein ACRDQ5_14710 [Sciscionella sp.]